MIVCQRPDILSSMLIKQKFKKLTCAIFDNDLIPSIHDDLFKYSIIEEMELDPEFWKCSCTSSGWEAEYIEIEYPFNSDLKIYGYLIIDKKNNLIFSERFSTAPFVFPPAGGTLNLKPKCNFS